MIKDIYLHIKTFRLLKSSLRVYLIILVIFSSFTLYISQNCTETSSETSSEELFEDLSSKTYKKSQISLKVDELTVNDPEAYFPNFLFYSVEVANALIDYLYDNISSGFYTSTDEQWREISRDNIKMTYDNAQAILALLKLSNAVINESEREYAIEISEKTGSYLISDLYDHIYDGFFTSQTNHYKKPGIQAKAIQALLSLYQITGNQTYREIAIDTFSFLDKYAWKLIDDNNGYYTYLLDNSGTIASYNPVLSDPYDPQSKRVDHNVLMGNALIDLYRLESDEKYLTHAQRIYSFFNSTCRNISTGLFYTGLNGTDEIVNKELSDIFINSLVLEFLAQLYNVTEDLKYYNDFFFLLYDLMTIFWDDRYGGFHATYSYIGEEYRDMKKYTERQIYAIRALNEAYKLSNNNIFYNLILDIFEFLNEKLYDNIHGGYFQLVNNDGSYGDPSWNSKYAVTQSLSIYSLASLWLYSKPGVLNAYWSPSTPLADKDSVNILVAAFDSDGISNVLFNYSINDGTYQIEEMMPHPFIGNMFNTTLASQIDGTYVKFHIIVNDTLGNQIIRSSYSFTWQHDIWAPHILEIGIDPSTEIPVNVEFSITVSAQDIPIQGEVAFVRMYYHLLGEEEKSIALENIPNFPYLWTTAFNNGLPTPGTYAYYFEAIDNRGNFDYSRINYFRILGKLQTPPLALIVGLLLIVFIFIPAGLYTYVEYKKKDARKTLKHKREVRYQIQRGKRKMMNSRGTRGKKRIRE
ncbi:MAG: hypothetical protein ACFFAU_07270 [Candidatus Hodarchaeota archaeon]